MRVTLDGERLDRDATLVEREVLPLIQWYQRKKRWPRRLHRLSGVLVIALGATIPLLSAYSASPPTRIVVGTAGAVITVITGLATVYEWQKTWRIFTVAQAELETERLAWELALARADADPDQDARLRAALTATEVLMEKASLARHSETAEFFASQSDPVRTPVLPGP
ncbi:MAG TPA: DUF4231 domain-containing protein [Mycobacteriales bacterium]